MIPAPPASIGPVFSVMDWDSQSKICCEKHLNGEKMCFLGAYLAIQCPYHICINLFVWYVRVGSAKNINKSTKRWENLRFKLRNLRGSYSAREIPRPRHIRNPHRASAFCRCSEVAFPNEASERMMLMMNKENIPRCFSHKKWKIMSSKFAMNFYWGALLRIQPLSFDGGISPYPWGQKCFGFSFLTWLTP